MLQNTQDLTVQKPLFGEFLKVHFYFSNTCRLKDEQQKMNSQFLIGPKISTPISKKLFFNHWLYHQPLACLQRFLLVQVQPQIFPKVLNGFFLDFFVSCFFVRGNIPRWSDIRLSVKGLVRYISNSLTQRMDSHLISSFQGQLVLLTKQLKWPDCKKAKKTDLLSFCSCGAMQYSKCTKAPDFYVVTLFICKE